MRTRAQVLCGAVMKSPSLLMLAPSPALRCNLIVFAVASLELCLLVPLTLLLLGEEEDINDLTEVPTDPTLLTLLTLLIFLTLMSY
jgi:hypothetical protein